MRIETFVKIRKNLAILILCSFLILGIIPCVEANGNIEWCLDASHDFYVIDADMDSISELNYAGQLESNYLAYTDRMYSDSQAAIIRSESDNTTSHCLDRAKEEFKIAMEQAAQATVNINKCVEANITGNKAEEDAYAQKFTESWKSYLVHKDNTYNLETGCT